MKKYFVILCSVLTLGMTSCVNDLKVESIDPNSSSTVDLNSLFVKVYATLGLTGQKGPDGSGDVAGVDEGTSSLYRMSYELQEFPADQIFWIWPDVGVDDVRKMKWTASNTLVKGLYARLYFDITLCNLFLDKFGSESDAAEKADSYQQAEVRFIRALNYWYLLDMFGNVPFVTKSGLTELPDQIERPDLYKWLVQELEDVATLLAPAGQRKSYYRVDAAAAWLLLSRTCLNAGVYGVDRNGVQKLNLKEEYDKATLYADKLISCGAYSLAPEYQHLFMSDNDNLGGKNQAYKEIILPICQDGQMTQSWGGSLFLIASCYTDGMAAHGSTESWKCIRSRAQLIGLFIDESKYHSPIADAITTEMKAKSVYGPYWGAQEEIIAATGDARACFVNSTKDGSDKYVCQFWKTNKSDDFLSGWGITKFLNLPADPDRVTSDSKHPDMDLPLMRLAEVYLNYAEAVLRGGEVRNGLTADEAVNIVRRRSIKDEAKANVTGWNITDKVGIMGGKNILDERGRELYSEGIRRSDMIRFNVFTGSYANSGYRWEFKAGELLGINCAPEDYRNLYPLPLSEVTANTKLKQNKGYEVQ